MCKKKILLLIMIIAAVLLILPDMAAQCPMCRLSAESNLANGGSAGRGLNRGILYLLAMPYLLIGGIAWYWWKNKKKFQDE